MDFTTTMRTRRAEKGWSQGELAEALHVSSGDDRWTRAIVTAIESGKREPKLSEAQLISGVLGFSLDALHDGDRPSAIHQDVYDPAMFAGASDRVELQLAEVREALRDLQQQVAQLPYPQMPGDHDG